MADEKQYEIKITQVEELEDGSAIVHIEMDSAAWGLLVEAGFQALLERYLQGLD